MVQERPLGLCDALFRALQVMRDSEDVLIGLPDTVWFPESGFSVLPEFISNIQYVGNTALLA